MPMYEYECQKCHQSFEVLQKMSDEPKAPCPACGGEGKRLVSQTSFALKGSGWYKDGYASSKPSTTATATSPKSGETKPKSDTIKKETSSEKGS
ncbi:MAG: zinc ribbon domain-containing protein [Deltaproteobacteria bacterium]|nr:zinc ribbon domain-containing protein [Deltaproteobacteria bacterium]